MEDVEKVRSRELSGRVAFLDGLIKSILPYSNPSAETNTQGLLHTGSLEHARDIATILGSIMPQLRAMLEEYRVGLVLVRERLLEEGELVLVWERESGKSEIKLV